MKIAVIGTGISGNLVARLLHGTHDVSVFEANDYIGGHANTVDVELRGRRFSVDTGFMVFNERTYPNFCRMLRMLGLTWQDSDMSFSVHCERTGLEYKGGGTLNELFAQRTNLIRPRFYRMLWDIVRFYRNSPDLLHEDQQSPALGEYLLKERYSREFVERYLVPMAAAIWSAPPADVLDFPAQFLVRFFKNHGLLQLRDQPQWKTVTGNSRRYVDALVEPLRERIRLSSPVQSIVRHEDHVFVRTRSGEFDVFDQVICATHADQTLRMLTDADDDEHEMLSAFPYQTNEAVLHTDDSMLPQRRRAWASWNYHIPREDDSPVSVTYDLSRLQRVHSPEPILLTLNHTAPIRREKILRQFSYEHPVFTEASIAAQQRHTEISGRRRTHFCGAYWGNGFHEDGVNSALAVAQYFGKNLDTCKAASTRDEFDIAASAR